MRVLVCGGRDFADRDLVFQTLDAVARKYGTARLGIIHGACPTGADKFAEEWAKSRRLPISASQRAGRRKADPLVRYETSGCATPRPRAVHRIQGR